MIETILRTTEKFIPKRMYRFFQPFYHYILSFLGALLYRFPSRSIVTIGVTGTKGKSTTAEIMYRILMESGHKTALINTVEFRIGEEKTRNYFKMTTPGRFFLQKFLRQAIKKGCTHAVVEVSSEAVLQYRHRYLYLDALIVTNLTPEHIERHGSFENYRDAKLAIVDRVICNGKNQKLLVTNGADPNLEKFRQRRNVEQFTFSLADAKPSSATFENTTFTWRKRSVTAKFIGEFNLENVLAALTLADALHLPREKAIAAVEKFEGTSGRVQKIEAGQNFTVIVDYAHTADSMEKLYKTFAGKRKICVFGATGGGRDKWKRPEMGKIASQYCDTIILTDDDSYDEDTRAIIADIEKGITNQKKEIHIDRREAIRAALKAASKDSAVLITGKGTDPFLMGPNGSKKPWSDADITREELQKLQEQ